MLKDGKTNVVRYTKKIMESQYMPVDELNEFRWKRLKHILDYAYLNIPFYRRWFESVHITPHDIKSHEDLIKLPVLTKEDIQNNLDEMISQQYIKDTLIRDKTGGSTGNPLEFYYTWKRFERRDAATVRHDSWAHLNIGDKVALLWGAADDLTPYKSFKAKVRNYLLERKLILDASSLSEEKMSKFVVRLNKFRPTVILAYANTMRLFSEFIQNNGLKVASPKSIICSAEVLLPETRELIERTFRTKIFNRYGCREFAVIASECEEHKGMHINSENLYLEFVKDGRHVEEGEQGEILVTDMDNYGMPLIRYNIKDIGRPIKKICRCGRTLPLMELSQGRVTDFLVTSSGKIVSGIAICTYMITNIPGIKQIQIIQDTKNHILIKLAKNSQFSALTLVALNTNIDKFLSPSMNRDFKFVEGILREPSGKYRFCISKIHS